MFVVRVIKDWVLNWAWDGWTYMLFIVYTNIIGCSGFARWDMVLFGWFGFYGNIGWLGWIVVLI